MSTEVEERLLKPHLPFILSKAFDSCFHAGPHLTEGSTKYMGQEVYLYEYKQGVSATIFQNWPSDKYYSSTLLFAYSSGRHMVKTQSHYIWKELLKLSWEPIHLNSYVVAPTEKVCVTCPHFLECKGL